MLPQEWPTATHCCRPNSFKMRRSIVTHSSNLQSKPTLSLPPCAGISTKICLRPSAGAQIFVQRLLLRKIPCKYTTGGDPLPSVTATQIHPRFFLSKFLSWPPSSTRKGPAPRRLPAAQILQRAARPACSTSIARRERSSPGCWRRTVTASIAPPCTICQQAIDISNTPQPGRS